MILDLILKNLRHLDESFSYNQEYWIDSAGNLTDAQDGMHEPVALQALFGDDEDVIEWVVRDYKGLKPKSADKYVKEIKYLKAHPDKPASTYMMEQEGWIRMVGADFQLHGIDDAKLKHIADAIWEASFEGEDITPDDAGHIEDLANKKYYTIRLKEFVDEPSISRLRVAAESRGTRVPELLQILDENMAESSPIPFINLAEFEDPGSKAFVYDPITGNIVVGRSTMGHLGLKAKLKVPLSRADSMFKGYWFPDKKVLALYQVERPTRGLDEPTDDEFAEVASKLGVSSMQDVVVVEDFDAPDEDISVQRTGEPEAPGKPTISADMAALLEYIRKLKDQDKWRVYSKKGKNMGTYGSLKAAKKRLGQIEFFKSQKESSVTEPRFQ